MIEGSEGKREKGNHGRVTQILQKKASNIRTSSTISPTNIKSKMFERVYSNGERGGHTFYENNGLSKGTSPQNKELNISPNESYQMDSIDNIHRKTIKK